MKGQSFLRADKVGDELINHLKFVISDPDPEGYVLIVGLTTWNDNRFDDPTCILNKEDGIEFISIGHIFDTATPWT